MNIDKVKIKFLIYILSFSFGLTLITYLLQLPHLITGKPNIVNEYYKVNFIKNVPLDLIFVLVYFLISQFFIKILKINDVHLKILIVAITTALLTFGFCYYFRSKDQTENFFSKWFHTVGYSSIVYDVILLTFIYIVYLKLLDYIT